MTAAAVLIRRRAMGRESFGERAVDRVGPAIVVADNLVSHVGPSLEPRSAPQRGQARRFLCCQQGTMIDFAEAPLVRAGAARFKETGCRKAKRATICRATRVMG